MDDRVTASGSRLSPDEIERRREAVSHAVANARLAGQYSSRESEALFERFIEGELEINEMIDLLKAKHGLGSIELSDKALHDRTKDGGLEYKPIVIVDKE